jgi:phosphonatase-like hydrolase
MNSKRKTLVVFDIAGTTVRDDGGVAAAFTRAFREYGIEVTEEEVQPLMGVRKIDAISIMLAKKLPAGTTVPTELASDIHQAFENGMISYYRSSPELTALPGAEQLFAYLHDHHIKVALNTGFPRRVTDAILEQLNWRNNPLIDAVVCSDEVNEGRPAPDMIRHIMSETGITDPETIIKVGDTEVDIFEGRNAGCGCVVGVTTGSYSREELEVFRPDFIIDSLFELPALIMKN